jgi:ABC-2 type transport system permease protein
MRPELIVAGKEIRDHVTSKRFLIVFAILLLISVYSIVSGMDLYNKQIDSYKDMQQQDWWKQQVQSLQDQIAKAQANGDSQDMIDGLQAQLDSMINPYMPSVMMIFSQLNLYFVWICALLAIALGFDLITREKEEGSLKSLLSHPIYRDSVINGKTLGAISVLVMAMGAMFLVTIAIMLFFSVIPSIDELLRIAGYFLMALIVCLAFFAIAMAASTLAKNSSMAVLYALGVIIVLAGLSMFSWNIVSFLAGPQPDVPIIYYNSGSVAEGDLVKTDLALPRASGPMIGASGSDPANNTSPPDATPIPEATTPPKDGVDPMPILPPSNPYDNKEYQDWLERQQLISSAITAISPISNFQDKIANAIISDYAQTGGIGVRPLMADSKIAYWSQPEKNNLWSALSAIWVNILVLIAEMLAAFGIAYIKFLRTDIR